MIDAFDPAKHIMQIKGKDYLETKWRLVWLRSVHPNASVETEMVRADDNGVTVRADVSWPVILHEADNLVHIAHATGYAMELWDKPGRIGAALENAETSALGRALAAAGFGTQFAPELDFDAGAERVADSPVQRPQDAPHARVRPDNRMHAHVGNASPEHPQNAAQAATPRDFGHATPKQAGFIAKLMRELDWERADAARYLDATYGVKRLSDLGSTQDVSQFIDHLLAVKAANEPAAV